MNHVIVTRVAVGVATLCAAAALLFAYLVTPSESQARAVDAAALTPEAPPPAIPAATQTQAARHAGAELYERFCSACHTLSDAIAMMRAEGSDLDANAKTMTAFLKTHGKSDDAQDVLIVDFIRQQAK
jgi:mono/diheme cytochrome c family protein